VDFDIVIIGSGFGGAITALRMAEKKCRVLVLERGRKWDRTTYPRKIDDPWIWSHVRPEIYNGWLDLRVFKGMSVAQGAGIGGGSLIYANISRVPPKSSFANRWPTAITYEGLVPYFRTVGQMLEVREVPVGQMTPRMQLMLDAAQSVGDSHRFERLDLAVSFDDHFDIKFDIEPNPNNTTIRPNKYGADQGTCVHLGECDIGCRVYAKNTLDKNYLPLAVKHGAQVRPLHLVNLIEPVSGGYCVYFDRLEEGSRVPGKVTAARVIVAGGSLGSTELLLRCRKEGKLPRLSSSLGRNWSSNGDFLTPAWHQCRDIWADRGPTIGSAINYLDGSQKDRVFWIQDGGIPNLLGKFFEAVQHVRRTSKSDRHWADELAPRSSKHALLRLMSRWDLFRHIMPWFAQGVDAGNAELFLDANGSLDMKWSLSESLLLFKEIADKHHELARATGGFPIPLPGWSLEKDLITPHALGGCNMGETEKEGVVDHKGEVFGHPGLYVADGAIVPRALGVNPSRTIGALAERIADLMPPCRQA